MMQRMIPMLLIFALAVAPFGTAWPQTASAMQGIGFPAGQPPTSSRTTVGSAPTIPRASFDLVAEYTFDPADSDTAAWTLGRDGRAGKRLSYLLPRNGIKTYAEPSLVKTAVNHRRPMIWLNRNDGQEPFNYTLVAIGNPELLLGLQMERAGSLHQIMPNLPTGEQLKTAKQFGICPRDLVGESRIPVQNLAVGRAISATLHAELVTRDGSFLPISISHIDFQPDADVAQLCYNSPGFALLAPSYTGWQDYQLHMVLMVLAKNGIAGPPGDGWSISCSSWQSGNWWTRFVSALYGC